MSLNVFLLISELIGTAAFAISGVLVAKKQKLDLFGAIVLGLTTAVGGGAIRDILLGYTPPIMFRDPIYAAVAAVTSLLAFALEKHSRVLEDSRKLSIILNTADTIGLGVFAASGINMVISSRYGGNAFLAIFVGTITAVGGGILRDVLAGQIPMVLRKRIYAVAAILGSCLYYALRHIFHLQIYTAEICCIGSICIIRYMAIRHLWNLPAFDGDDTPPESRKVSE